MEVSVTVFGGKPEYSEVLRIIYEFMCERTLKELPKLKDFEENPYLTEDFFGMMGRFLKYSPEIALLSKTLQISLQLAEIGIGYSLFILQIIICVFILKNLNEGVKHIEVAKTIYMFIENLLGLCDEKNEKFSEIHTVKNNELFDVNFFFIYSKAFEIYYD